GPPDIETMLGRKNARVHNSNSSAGAAAPARGNAIPEPGPTPEPGVTDEPEPTPTPRKGKTFINLIVPSMAQPFANAADGAVSGRSGGLGRGGAEGQLQGTAPTSKALAAVTGRST
ncbi:hypothetical protein THAOC_23577, partial [Thalassiosira oceanica]